MSLIVHVLLGAVLLVSGLAKMRNFAHTRAAMATFGITGTQIATAVATGVITMELVLGAAIAMGSERAAIGAAVVMTLFMLALLATWIAGRAGQPCACFGTGSIVSGFAILRTAVLAALFAAVPFVDRVPVNRQYVTEAAAAIGAVGVVALAVVVVGLAREIASLKIRQGPHVALDIHEEGPRPGSRHEVLAHTAESSGSPFALAVFSSPNCPLCRSLKPAIDQVRRQRDLAVREFDEEDDPEAWQALDVPGSPYAVIASADGTVLSKGTFNTLGQLNALIDRARLTQKELRVVDH